MSEFTSIRSKVFTLSTGVQAIDADRKGGCSVTIQNANAAGGNTVYVGPKANAGVALSAATGYPLAPGQSWSADFTFTTGTVGDEEDLSVIGTTGDKVAVLILMP